MYYLFFINCSKTHEFNRCFVCRAISAFAHPNELKGNFLTTLLLIIPIKVYLDFYLINERSVITFTTTNDNELQHKERKNCMRTVKLRTIFSHLDSFSALIFKRLSSLPVSLSLVYFSILVSDFVFFFLYSLVNLKDGLCSNPFC